MPVIILAAGIEAFGTYKAVCLQLLEHTLSKRSATLQNGHFASVDVVPERNDFRGLRMAPGGGGDEGTVQLHSLIAT